MITGCLAPLLVRSYLCGFLSSSKDVVPCHVSLFTRWIPSDEGFVKLNTDAASYSAQGVVGLGCAVCASFGCKAYDRGPHT
ncbi:hypothetical protein ACOSQ3_031427 [Xanthoceras sorbifolium]